MTQVAIGSGSLFRFSALRHRAATAVTGAVLILPAFLPAPAHSADWVAVPGTSRQYDRSKVGVHRVHPNSKDIDGKPMVDSIQIVFRDGSSMSLYCAQNRYTMWDTVTRKYWGGAVTDMPLAQTMSAQFCPQIHTLPCKPTYMKGDPPCNNK